MTEHSNQSTTKNNKNNSPNNHTVINVSAAIPYNLNNSHNNFSKISDSSTLDIKNVIQETKTTIGVKRLQVPRACAQCRKSHAGCDLERPCKRCRQNGMEALCSDIPRKKRESKKKIVEGTDDDWLMSPVTSPSMTTPKKEDDWDQYAEVFGLSSPSMNHVTSHEFISRMPQSGNQTSRGGQNNNGDNGNTHFPMLHTIYQASNLPSSLSEHLNYTPTYHYTTNLNNVNVNVGNDNFGNLSDISSESPQQSAQSVTPQTNISKNELNYLLSQIKDLRESNKSLEQRLQNVTKELIDLKRQKANHLQSISMLTNWHSFVPQADLAISVWKSTQVKGKNVLVECNDKFIQLLGFPVEILKSGFTSHKLTTNKTQVEGNEFWPEDEDEENEREWPKRTQIMTAQGLQDVYITVNPVPDHFSDSKYWIVHMLPIQMT